MDNIFKNNQYRILELFIENSNKKFSIRGIARELKLSHVTVLNYIEEILKLGLIKKDSSTLYPTYYVNLDSESLKEYKKNYVVYKINKSGLLGYLENKFYPNVIVLFGSAAKGLDRKDSDIDIFVQAKEKDINLGEFEKKLGRKVHIIFKQKISDLSKELLSNIINGIVLYGYLRV